MKFIRWKGLITFAVILSLIAGGWYFLADGMIKKIIETVGTNAVGGKVDLGKADLSLSPLGLTLTDLQVTNPDEPMENIVQVGRIAFLMEPGHLLLGKVIINEMALDNVRTNTKRTRSGTIREKKKPAAKEKKRQGKIKASEKAFALPAIDVPNVSEILQREELETLKAVESIRSSVKGGEEKWNKRLDELPDSEKIKEYKGRFKKIKKSFKGGLKGILGGAGALDELRDDIKKDIKNVKKAKKELKEDIKKLKKEVKGVEKLPKEDLKRLKKKYALSPEGLSNFSRLLFGGKIAAWIATAVDWYGKAEPLLEKSSTLSGVEKKRPPRGKGLDIRFREFRPMPDFLVKKAGLSVIIPAGDIKGEVRNITDDQAIINSPTTFVFTGDKLKGIKSINIDGQVDHIDVLRPKDTVNIKVSGYSVKDVELSKSDDFPVTLRKARADFNLKALHSKGRLDVDLKALFGSVDLESGITEDAGRLKKALASTLSDVKSFNLKAALSGTLENYNMDLSSNLDDVLRKAVGAMVKRESARLEEELKSAIEEKIKAPMAKLKGELGGLDIIDGKFSSYIKELDGLLRDAKDSGKKGFKLPF